MIRKKTVCEHTEREQEDKKEAGDTVHLEKVGGTRNEESVIPTW